MALLQPILTIGHSRHSLPRFIALLETARTTSVADVRSAPVSRFSPHFNKRALAVSLDARGIAYVFLGNEFGGRPQQQELFTGGVANYEKMAAAPSFQSDLDQLMLGAEDYRIAVMCSEADPLDCHCCLLVGRALAGAGVEVGHILASGAVMSHSEAEERLLHLADLAEPGLLLSSRAMRLAEAYRCRCSEVAYARPAEPSASRGGTRRRD